MYPNVEYGSMFAKWLTEEIDSYESFGNGSAMRVSYIGEFLPKITPENYFSYVSDCINQVKDLSMKSAKCTHNTLSGVRAATTIALLITLSKLGFSKTELFMVLSSLYSVKSVYTGTESLDEFRRTYQWCDFADHTVPIAFRCFYESEDYESCMRNCFSLDCDMDTMCCIAGSIAESYYGTTGLDNKTVLQKYLTPHLYECIKD